jgi:3-hydroxyacyl-[acyl-carrier-protein] dehydratase
MPRSLILDPTQLDLTNIVADVEQIRLLNPQRGDMEHVNAVVLLDESRDLVAGYKDVRHDEFWVAGHVPGNPLLPGVIMCEAAAQLVCYYVKRKGILLDAFMALGGIDSARFRAPVRPSDRLVMIGQGKRVHRRQTVFDVQGFVGATMAFECQITGVPILRGAPSRNGSHDLAHETAPGG